MTLYKDAVDAYLRLATFEFVEAHKGKWIAVSPRGDYSIGLSETQAASLFISAFNEYVYYIGVVGDDPTNSSYLNKK